MMMKNRILLASIIMMLSIACEEKVQGVKFSDPFLEAFKGKKIKYTVGRRYSSKVFPGITNDTTEFDENGNLIRYKEWGTEVLTSYNDSNFITRVLKIDDIPYNYWITYSEVNGDLLQQWNRLNHFNWKFETSDVRDTLKVVEFKIDKYGKVISELDKDQGQFTIFKYSDNRLINKKIYSIGDSSILQDWEYTYNNTLLSTIVVKEKGYTVHYLYTNGLLDSLWNPEYSIKYKYVLR